MFLAVLSKEFFCNHAKLSFYLFYCNLIEQQQKNALPYGLYLLQGFSYLASHQRENKPLVKRLSTCESVCPEVTLKTLAWYHETVKTLTMSLHQNANNFKIMYSQLIH